MILVQDLFFNSQQHMDLHLTTAVGQEQEKNCLQLIHADIRVLKRAAACVRN